MLDDFLHIDFSDEIRAKVHMSCDNCRTNIDRSKPKAEKGKDGKPKPPKQNPAIEAELEYPLDSGEYKKYNLCSEECLRQYLNKRNSKGKK